MTPLNVQDLRRRAEKRAQYWNSASLPCADVLALCELAARLTAALGALYRQPVKREVREDAVAALAAAKEAGF